VTPSPLSPTEAQLAFKEFMVKRSDGVPTSHDDSLERAGFSRQIETDTILQETTKLRGAMPKINPLHFSFRHFWKLDRRPKSLLTRTEHALPE
jgi:hypothetical protein